MGTNLLGRSSTDKNLGVLVDNKLSLSVAHKQCVLGPKGDPVPLLIPAEATSGVLCPILGSSVPSKCGTTGECRMKGNEG